MFSYCTLLNNQVKTMDIETFDDVHRAAKAIGVSIESIARAFGIRMPENEPARLRELLFNATTQTERWRVWGDAQRGSNIEAKVLQEILKNATTPEER